MLKKVRKKVIEIEHLLSPSWSGWLDLKDVRFDLVGVQLGSKCI